MFVIESLQLVLEHSLFFSKKYGMIADISQDSGISGGVVAESMARNKMAQALEPGYSKEVVPMAGPIKSSGPKSDRDPNKNQNGSDNKRRGPWGFLNLVFMGGAAGGAAQHMPQHYAERQNSAGASIHL